MNVLILGGTGAMGTPLSRLVAASGNNVYVTSRSAHTSRDNLHYLHGNAKDEIFLKECLNQMQYDVIVDFMSYSTKEFEKRVDLLLKSAKQYIFISSARIFAESKTPLTENSPRLLETVQNPEYLKTDEYALSKARQEEIIYRSGFSNYTIIRPSVTYNTYRLQIGKEECLKQSYNVVIGKSIKWQDVLTIYLNAIEKITGQRPKVVMNDETIKLKDKLFKYQVIYARRLNRVFDNAKIKEVYHEDFITPEDGLLDCLEKFLKEPAFHSINWKYEAWNDKISKEYTPLSEISTLRNKLMYLCYRFQVGWIFEASQRLWHRIKKHA